MQVVQNGRISMAGTKSERQIEQLRSMQLKTQNQLNQLLGFDQHQARNLEDELTLAMRNAIIQLGVDQLENLKELRKVGHPFQAGFDLTEADGLLLAVSENQQVLIYLSAKCNITAKLIAESKKQMDCYSQLLKNIRVTLDAGDLSMTNQALLLKDLPSVQANPGARLTYRFQATCQALSALASQNTLIVGFIGSANMLEDCSRPVGKQGWNRCGLQAQPLPLIPILTFSKYCSHDRVGLHQWYQFGQLYPLRLVVAYPTPAMFWSAVYIVYQEVSCFAPSS